MTEMPDVLKLHADGSPDKHAVIVDASHGARLVGDDLRRAQRAGEPAGARAARGRRPAGRPPGLVRAELARGHRGDPRGPEGRPGRGAAVVPVQLGRDAVRDRQLGRDPRDRGRRVRAAHRGRARPAPEGAGLRRLRGDRGPGRAPGRMVVVARRDRRPARRRAVGSPTRRASARRCSTRRARPASPRALRTTTNREIVFALLAELGLQFGNEVHITTGPMYHSGPLAFVSINHTLGAPIVVLRRFDPVAWLAAVKLHSATNTFSAPTQLKRVVSLPARGARPRRPLVDALPDRERGAGAVRAEAGDHREARRRLPVRGVRLDRARDHHGAAARGPAAQAGIVRQALRRHRVPHREGRRHRSPAEGEAGELFMSTGLAMDGYHRTTEQLSEYDEGALEVRRRHRVRRRRGLPLHLRPQEGHDHLGRREHLPRRDRAVIYQHPGVLDVAVFGIPDDEWGESVYCIVQPKAPGGLDLDDLEAFVAARVAGYKRPAGTSCATSCRARTPASC